MGFSYVIELKYRMLLIVVNVGVIINTSYFYKHILLFLLVKHLIYNESITFYLISTNSLELLNLYFNIIHTIISSAIFYHIIYNLVIFLNHALYKREYELIRLALYLWLVINTGLALFIILVIFPIIWEFFKYYQQIFVINLIYFETKVNEHYTLFFSTYLLTKYCLLTFILAVFLLKSYFNKPVLIKTRKVSIFIITSLLTFIGNILIQSIVCVFFVISYELVLIYITYKKYYTDKIGLEPIILKT